MKDSLRDAIRDAMPGDKQFAEKLADAIDARIDERIEAAKPQPAEPRRWVVSSGGRKHEESSNCARYGCTPFEVEAARQNPYADWETWSGGRVYEIRDVLKARFAAWNEGAQIAGERDA